MPVEPATTDVLRGHTQQPDGKTIEPGIIHVFILMLTVGIHTLLPPKSQTLSDTP